MNLDKTQPYGLVYGHERAHFEQGGVLFGADGVALDHTAPPTAPDPKDRIIDSPDVENARTFLMNVLKNGALSKSAVYKLVLDNNQNWQVINNAAELMGVVRFAYQKHTMWKLPEEA